MTLGPVALTVADLDRSTAYYERLGLQVHQRDGDTVVLGVPDRPLLELTGVPGARPADGFTGLFHFAILLPRRADLARWLAHAAGADLHLTGASDHFVSEALYLRDPDHHGIEVYWDRPRELWEGQVMERMTSFRLDLDSLMDELGGEPAAPYEGMPEGTVMGHVHLRVRDVAETIAYYRDELGLELMAHLGDQAAFFAAGGYHHHFGANTWESRGATPAPDGHATLRHATIVVPEPGRDEVVADPSGNRLRILSA